ncbi:MAG: hypothetical protein M1834_005306 [Cirrosporium novae-zelandiae]|nr:MAG: hypothetical protein M1834_005306 [Cirrosporium novae-zelandiae]
MGERGQTEHIEYVEDGIVPPFQEDEDQIALGLFSREECIDFLVYKLGPQAVSEAQVYKGGLEWLFARLWEHYGAMDAIKAVDVFKDLVESEKNSWGLGDDGDIWRNWRHEWKLHNVNPIVTERSIVELEVSDQDEKEQPSSYLGSPGPTERNSWADSRSSQLYPDPLRIEDCQKLRNRNSGTRELDPFLSSSHRYSKMYTIRTRIKERSWPWVFKGIKEKSRVHIFKDEDEKRSDYGLRAQQEALSTPGCFHLILNKAYAFFRYCFNKQPFVNKQKRFVTRRRASSTAPLASNCTSVTDPGHKIRPFHFDDLDEDIQVSHVKVNTNRRTLDLYCHSRPPTILRLRITPIVSNFNREVDDTPMHSLDLNRALPPLPPQSNNSIVSEPSQRYSESTKNSNSPITRRTTGSTDKYSTAPSSTVLPSSSPSRFATSISSSKREFQRMACGLLNSSLPTDSEMRFEDEDFMDPTKWDAGTYDPADHDSSKEKRSPIKPFQGWVSQYQSPDMNSYGLIYNSSFGMQDASGHHTTNGSFDGRKTQWPISSQAVEAAGGFSMDMESYPIPDYDVQKTFWNPKGMTQSRSEGSIAVMRPSYMSSPAHSLENERADVRKTAGTPTGSPVRCKSVNTYSPTKALMDIDEEGDTTLFETPKRPRSPSKKLFGENGWLGRTPSFKEPPDERYKKSPFKKFQGKLKQRMENISEDVHKKVTSTFTHADEPVKKKNQIPPTSAISIDPPNQARMYCEIELMICAAANEFLMSQHRQGRMSITSIVKIKQFWASRGRPEVTQFRYDQGTQRDLILANMQTFRFNGDAGKDPMKLNAIMCSWKSVAYEMSIRTFCSPDTVIRKHLHHARQILELVNAPYHAMMAFAQIEVRIMHLMRQAQVERDSREPARYSLPTQDDNRRNSEDNSRSKRQSPRQQWQNNRSR